MCKHLYIRFEESRSVDVSYGQCVYCGKMFTVIARYIKGTSPHVELPVRMRGRRPRDVGTWDIPTVPLEG